MQDVDIKCNCGQVHLRLADVTQGRGTHCRCYCKDCRAFSRHLGAAAFIGDHGAATIFQTRPDRLTILAGHDHLQPLRLGPKGLLRWYARCCNTPIANTMPSLGLPFVGIVTGAAADTTAFGPVIVEGFTKSAISPPASLKDKGLPTAIGRILRRALGAYATGKGRVSPFFENGQPIAQPIVLTKEQRAAANA